MSSLFATLVTEAGEFMAPLEAAADDEQARRDLVRAIGLDLDPTQLQNLSGRLQTIKDALTDVEALADSLSDDDAGSLGDIWQAVEIIGSLFDAIHGIDEDLPSDVPDDVGGDLVEYLFVRYLFVGRPTLLHALVVCTVVDLPDPPEDQPLQRRNLYPATVPPGTAVEFDRIGEVLADPAGELRAAYDRDDFSTVEDVAALGEFLFPALSGLFGAFGFRIAYGQRILEIQDFRGVPDLTHASRTLTVSRDIGAAGQIGARFGLAASPDGPCLVVVPMGAASMDFEGDEWTLSLSIGAGFDIVVLNTDGVALAEPDTGEITGSLVLDKTIDPDSGTAYTLGPTDGTRLELGQTGIESSIAASEGTVEVDVSGAATDSELVVSPADGDSFIQHVLPDDGVSVGFDAGLGWSTERGVYVEGGGAGLSTDIPVNLNIADVVSVDTLRLAAQPDLTGESVTIPVHVAANPQVSLGPIDAVVEGIGLEAEIAFPENDDGNLGPLDVELGFKPPTGAGLSVDAGAVVGGGYLEFDPENERYAGVLQLQVGELTLTAVGLLTTQLPGGRDGFSLLVIISGEFPPVQLGFGFTLNAVGGLLGLNRTIDVDYLVTGLGDGTIDSIMFPEDPVRNAPQIISDLRNGFPVAAANHVFGPMARLGWGTPTVLSADIGVLMELPDPIRIVILGRVHAGFPHEEVGIVVFNMDVIGAVDFGAQTADAQATLYDSRVMAYTLTGDMAMKTGWGDDPEFVLSVGGFNPRYDPPEDLPELRRIALELGPGNPRIRWEGYFAMTANTVQVGAAVEVYAEASKFSLEGNMGFDTLFRFEPFELIADFYAGFAVSADGKTLLSVDVDGTLAGPGPWNVSGEASFEIWPIEFSVSFDEEFGESAESDGLPPADVFGQVVAALGDERNWSAQRPEDGDSVVTLRPVEAEAGTVLAHPLGQFSVRQKVAPLAVSIDEFSGATPAGADRFEIVDVTVGDSDEDPDEPTREQFARGEYFDLSDDEKIEGPEFERFEAGRHLTNTGFGWGGEDDADLLGGDVLTYETAVIDQQVSVQPIHLEPVAMPQRTAESLAAVSAVARGPLRTTGAARYEIDEEETQPTGVHGAVAVADGGYVVARTADLTQVAVDGVPDAGTTKTEAEQALDAHLDGTGDDPDDYQVVGAHEALDGEGDA